MVCVNAERQGTEVPIKSEAQRRLMYAAMKDPKGTGIPRSVAEKFVGPKAHKESDMKKPMPAFLMKKDDKKPKKMMGGGAAYAKGGGVESKGKTKGKMVKMAMGGKAC
jgi:hypothetical protein